MQLIRSLSRIIIIISIGAFAQIQILNLFLRLTFPKYSLKRDSPRVLFRNHTNQ